jgi:hypothetical protein
MNEQLDNDPKRRQENGRCSLTPWQPSLSFKGRELSVFRVDGRTLEDDAEAPLLYGSLIELEDSRLQFFTAEERRKADSLLGV